MKWVTRERPKIDRIACPWLIACFIDKEPEFRYVPGHQVLKVAAATGAVPYDVPSVERIGISNWPKIKFHALREHAGLVFQKQLEG